MNNKDEQDKIIGLCHSCNYPKLNNLKSTLLSFKIAPYVYDKKLSERPTSAIHCFCFMIVKTLSMLTLVLINAN